MRGAPLEARSFAQSAVLPWILGDCLFLIHPGQQGMGATGQLAQEHQVLAELHKQVQHVLWHLKGY